MSKLLLFVALLFVTGHLTGTIGQFCALRKNYCHKYKSLTPRLIRQSDSNLVKCCLSTYKEREPLSTHITVEWMGKLFDRHKHLDMKLTDLQLPGTHDSGALYRSNQFDYNSYHPHLGHCGGTGVAESWATNQDLPIAHQLLAGARAFDIRPKCFPSRKNRGGIIWNHHGICSMDPNLSESLCAIGKFLDKYRQEIVVVFLGADDMDGSECSNKYYELVKQHVGRHVLPVKDYPLSRSAPFKLLDSPSVRTMILKNKRLLLIESRYANFHAPGFQLSKLKNDYVADFTVKYRDLDNPNQMEDSWAEGKHPWDAANNAFDDSEYKSKLWRIGAWYEMAGGHPGSNFATITGYNSKMVLFLNKLKYLKSSANVVLFDFLGTDQPLNNVHPLQVIIEHNEHNIETYGFLNQARSSNTRYESVVEVAVAAAASCVVVGLGIAGIVVMRRKAIPRTIDSTLNPRFEDESRPESTIC